jgi:hypothetical protein
MRDYFFKATRTARNEMISLINRIFCSLRGIITSKLSVFSRVGCSSMKNQLLVALSYVVLSSATLIRREPQERKPPVENYTGQILHVLEQVAPNIKSVATSANPQIRPDAKRKILRFGPHNIPPSKVLSLSVDPEYMTNCRSQVTISSPGHGHGSAPSNSTAPKDWANMTIGQAIGLLTGGNPGMGMQLITLGQVSNLIGAVLTGADYISPLKEIINAPQDPNGWTSHRTFKASELCHGCTVLSVKSDIVYENGTRADISRGLYLHHTASLNLGLHTNVNWIKMCPNSQTTWNGINVQDFLPREIPSGGILSLGTVDEYSNASNILQTSNTMVTNELLVLYFKRWQNQQRDVYS